MGFAGELIKNKINLLRITYLVEKNKIWTDNSIFLL